jgi:hypothetical protein
MRRGIYDRHGEVFAYLEGDRVHNLEGEQVGYRRGQVIYSMSDEKIWTIEGDGLYADGGAIGYIGSPLMRDE